MIPRLTLRALCGETEMLMSLIYLKASKFDNFCILKRSIIKLPDLNFATFLTSPHDLDCSFQLWMEKTIAVTLYCVLYFTCILLFIPKWELNFVLTTFIKSVHSVVSTPVCVKWTSSTYMNCWRSLKSLAYTVKPGETGHWVNRNLVHSNLHIPNSGLD